MAEIKLSKEEIEFILIREVELKYNVKVKKMYTKKMYTEDYMPISTTIFEVE